MAAKPDFGRIIKANNFAMKAYSGFSLLLLAVGGILLLGNIGEGEGFWIRFGGIFTGTLASFPVTKLLARLRHNNGVAMVSELWDSVHSAAEPDANRVARLEDLVWKMLEKEALG